MFKFKNLTVAICSGVQKYNIWPQKDNTCSFFQNVKIKIKDFYY